jgi:FkbM family methyltransferase
MITSLITNKKIYVTNESQHDFITKCMISCGYFAKFEVMFLKSILLPGNNVIEIGSNIGSHSIYISEYINDHMNNDRKSENKSKNSTGTLFCFEPQLEVYKTLCTNLLLNDCKNVVPYNYGISNKKSVIYYDEKEVNSLNTGEFSIIRLSNEKVNEKDLNEYMKKKSIKTQTLDYFLPDFSSPIHLIKIDVEEMEVIVLRECIPLILKYQPDLFIEYSDKSFHVLIFMISVVNKLISMKKENNGLNNTDTVSKYNIYYFNTSQEQHGGPRKVADINIFCSIREHKNLSLVPENCLEADKNGVLVTMI